MATLKVFRTAIGFHDAYVAVPSKKAALTAWGTKKDLFTRGAAEIVTDAELTRLPLSEPGTVFKLSRGSAADQMAALTKGKPPQARSGKTAASKPKAPKPDRGELDAATKAIRDAETDYRDTDRKFAAQMTQLEKQRRELGTAHRRALARLEKARSTQDRRFRTAMEKWRRD